MLIQYKRRQQAVTPANAVTSLVLDEMSGFTKTRTMETANTRKTIFPETQRRNENRAYTPNMNLNTIPGCATLSQGPTRNSTNGNAAANAVRIQVAQSSFSPDANFTARPP
jgi:hypothetical protein